jgi:hypothetical protein
MAVDARWAGGQFGGRIVARRWVLAAFGVVLYKKIGFFVFFLLFGGLTDAEAKMIMQKWVAGV